MQNWFHKTFRILNWAPRYSRPKLWGDVKAGLTTGSMLIAQGMADALIMGMPPIYGLYASFFPLLIYPLLGTSRNLSVGPVTADSLIISAGVSLLAASSTTEYITLVILLTMLTGLLELLVGTLRLGVVFKVFSRPVIAGFVTAAPFIIACTQLDHLLGIQLPNSQHITVLVGGALSHLSAVHGLTVAWSATALFLLVLLRYVKPRWPAAVIVLAGGIFVAWLTNISQTDIQIVGSIPHGLPGFSLPQISLYNIRRLLPTAFTLALVEFMSVASLGKAFAKRHNYRIDTNHELVAIGASNFFGSMFNALPVSGSFSRSAAADQAGGKTALANWFTASVILLTLLFLTGVFYFLPMPVLAAIIIVAVSGLIDFAEIRNIFIIKKIDGTIAILTFLCTLFIGIQQGILIGIAASVLVLFYEYWRSSTAALGIIPNSNILEIIDQTELPHDDNMLILRLKASLTFVSADVFQDSIHAKIDDHNGPVKAIVIDTAGINTIDTTAIGSIKSTIESLQKRGIALLFAEPNPALFAFLERAGLQRYAGNERLYESMQAAVHKATAARKFTAMPRYKPDITKDE